MLNEISLKNKTALITGGGTGIGLAIAEEMKDAGANVIIVGRRVGTLKEAVKKIGEGASYFQFDVKDIEKMPAFIKEIEEKSPIDILVNNAGINVKKPFFEFTLAEYEDVLKTHATASFMLTQEVAKYMKERRKGSIIMITSLNILMGMKSLQPYSMAKAALGALSRSLTAELASFGIRVNSLNPGFTDTDMMRRTNLQNPERHAEIQAITPMQKYAAPKDLGMAAAFLASDAAGFITGIDLVVDGGISCSFSV